VKLEKNVTGFHKMLQQIYGQETLNRTQIFVWVKHFGDGRESVTDDDGTVHLTTLELNQMWKKLLKWWERIICWLFRRCKSWT